MRHISIRSMVSSTRRLFSMARAGMVGGAAAMLLATPIAASAVPVLGDPTICIGLTCIVEAVPGPVAVDPLGFTLEAGWGPEHIELLPNPGGGHWRLELEFNFTGVHSGLEHMGLITLLDHAGNPLALNENFDDLNPIGATSFTANYEIFVDNPGDIGNSFFVRGFTLGPSDGSGVTTLEFVRAEFSPAAIGTAPEPAMILLLGVAGAAALRRARRG